MQGIGFNIETAFANTPPTNAQTQRYERVLAAGRQFATTIVAECGPAPYTFETEQSLINLEQCCLWAQRSITATKLGTHAGGAAGPGG